MYQYRNEDGTVNLTKLRAARKEVQTDTTLSVEEKAQWLSRFDAIVKSRDSKFPAQMKTQASGQDVHIDILGDIGESFFDEGTTAKSVASAIKGATGTVKIRMNSPGGSAWDGIAISNILAQSPNKVEVNIIGLAASAASMIAMGADEVSMAENAVMMIHEASTAGMGGRVKDFEAAISSLKAVNKGAAELYSRRSGKHSPEYMADLMSKETWLTAKEAVELGLADIVSAPQSMTMEVDLEDVPEHLRASLTPASDNQDIQSNMLTLIALRLGLPESATEAEVMAMLDAKLQEIQKQDEEDPEVPTEPAVEPSVVQKASEPSDLEALQAAKALADAALAQLHDAAVLSAVERNMAAGKIPPAMRDAAIKACGKTAESLKAACDMWEQYPTVVATKSQLPSKLPTNKVTQLTPQQKKLAASINATDEQFLAAMNGDR